MIRNFVANAVCSSGCVCFYAKNGVPLCASPPERSGGAAGKERRACSYTSLG